MNKDKARELTEVIQSLYGNIAGMIVTKDNELEYEYYDKDFNRESSIHVASVTKSILSLLIGIALRKGAIKNIDQRVLEYFPEYKIKRGEKKIQEITVRNLLTMTAPFKFKYEPYTKVYSSEDWTKASLDLLGGKGKIGDFKYTTIGLQILSGLLVNATGQPLLDFADENLFSPLGIEKKHHVRIQSKEEHLAFLKGNHGSGWVVDPKGVNTAGWGLTLTTLDMVKIGQLCLNRGEWKRKSLISPGWIEESTSEHSLWGERPYGYLWWIMNGYEGKCYAAIGDGGNIVFIHPEKNIVVAITSRFMPRAKDRMELIGKNILPLLGVS